MSLEPVVAALCGLILLGERLSGTQWIAVAAIVIASAGVATSVGQGAKPSPGSV